MDLEGWMVLFVRGIIGKDNRFKADNSGFALYASLTDVLIATWNGTVLLARDKLGFWRGRASEYQKGTISAWIFTKVAPFP